MALDVKGPFGGVADSLDEAPTAFRRCVGGGQLRSAFSGNCGQERLGAGDSVDDPDRTLAAQEIVWRTFIQPSARRAIETSAAAGPIRYAWPCQAFSQTAVMASTCGHAAAEFPCNATWPGG
jgi:hypothetical protein